MEAERLSSHGLGFYREVKQALQGDPTWSALATQFNYSFVHECTGPVNAIFFLRFEGGDLCEAVSLSSAAGRQADLKLSASVETWRSIFADEMHFVAAFTMGAVKVEGLQPEYGRHICAFRHLLGVMQTITARRRS